MFRPAQIRRAVLVALLSIACAVPAAFARGGPKEHALTGTIQKVDGQTLVVHTGQGDESVVLNSGCPIRRSGKMVPAEQLVGEEGSRVKVRYIEDNGTRRATSVTLAARK